MNLIGVFAGVIWVFALGGALFNYLKIRRAADRYFFTGVRKDEKPGRQALYAYFAFCVFIMLSFAAVGVGTWLGGWQINSP